MSTKRPSDYKVDDGSFEWKPTGGIQSIADKTITVVKIDSFNKKDGDPMCIVETDKPYSNIEYKNEDGEKTKGEINRFFCSPRELMNFFTNAKVMKSVNEDGEKIEFEIEKIPFDEEAIKRDSSLKSKTHWVFKNQNKKIEQEHIA